MVLTPLVSASAFWMAFHLRSVAPHALRRAKAMFVVVGRDFGALIELLLVGVAVRFRLGRIVAGGFCHRRNVPAVHRAREAARVSEESCVGVAVSDQRSQSPKFDRHFRSGKAWNNAPDSFDLAPEFFFGDVVEGSDVFVDHDTHQRVEILVPLCGSQDLALRGRPENLLGGRFRPSQIERPLLAFQCELAARILRCDEEVKFCARTGTDQLAPDAVAVRPSVFDHVGVPRDLEVARNHRAAAPDLSKGFEIGGACRGRTYDLLIKSQLLYQLS